VGLNETIVFYVVIGIAVAVAVYLRGGTPDAGQRTFRVATAVLFWPLYLPLLLSAGQPQSDPPATPRNEARDEMAQAIAEVDAELEAALSSLDGWAEDVLAREKDRIQELRSAWNAQAARIREMDRLLARPEVARTAETAVAGNRTPITPGASGLRSTHDSPESDQQSAINGQQSVQTTDDSQPTSDHSPELDRRRQSELARRKNIERLRQVRRQAYDDLMGTLAWVRELVSMIHLAKFTGAPAARAEELVTQIAAAVEGISAVTWREERESISTP
jgi:hypothetical protein